MRVGTTNFRDDLDLSGPINRANFHRVNAATGGQDRASPPFAIVISSS